MKPYRCEVTPPTQGLYLLSPPKEAGVPTMLSIGLVGPAVLWRFVDSSFVPKPKAGYMKPVSDSAFIPGRNQDQSQLDFPFQVDPTSDMLVMEALR